MIDRSVAAVRRGSWGPLHATIFGAWFAPFAAMAWVGWALSAYSGAAAVTPATASLLLTLVLLAIAVRLYWRARPVAMPSYFQSGRFWALFWGVIVIELAVLLAGNVLLTRAGRAVWILPLVLAVVGLHFLPLAYINRNPIWYGTGEAVATVLIWPSSATISIPGAEHLNAWLVVMPWLAATVFWLTSALSALVAAIASAGERRTASATNL